MSEGSDDENTKWRSRDELIESQLLHTEYEQAGEEYRYRDKLLHNSYYLLIVITALLIGPTLRYIGQGDRMKLGVVMFLAGGLYTLLGLIILTHYVQRNSAASLRTRVEQIAEGVKTSVPRPFAVQYRVIGKDTSMNSNNELQEARPFFKRVISKPEYLHSAETLAQLVLIAGFLLILAGVYLLTSRWAFVHTLVSTIAVFVVIVIFVVLLRKAGSDVKFR